MGYNRYIVVVILLVVFCSITAGDEEARPLARLVKPAEGIRWFSSYQIGLKEAQEKKRPVLIDFYAPWCGWCKKMDEDVFAKADIAGELRNFVCVKVDVESDHKVALAYGVQSLPRIIVINTHGEVVGDWLGYRDAKGFAKLLEDVSEYLQKSVGGTPMPEIAADESDVVQKVENIRVDPNAANELMELLGHKDAAVRVKVTEALVQRGPDVLEMVLPALNNNYLGTRIAAWGVIRELILAKADFDPWASRAQRSDAVKMLRTQIAQKDTKASPPAPDSKAE